MNKQKRYMALDFGVGRGTAMAGSFDGRKVALEPMYRFPVLATAMLGVTYWDFPGMLINAKRGLSRFAAQYGATLDAVGTSSWAFDFGLLDKTGHLLANPVHFMDSRTSGAPEKLQTVIPGRSLYQKTGIKARRQNTLYQLFAMATANSPLLDKAVTLLLTADLVSYFLTGTPVQEYTLATTTGMYDAESRDWSRDIILSAKIPPVMVPEIIAPGTVIGSLLDGVASECGLGPMPVIAPASYGAADAVAAVPASGDGWLYIATDYMNQIGIETAAPVINDDAFAAGFANEGGVDGSYRLSRSINARRLLEGCMNVWSAEGALSLDWDEVRRLAEGAKPLERLVNPDAETLLETDDIPGAINMQLRESGQPLADTGSDFVRLCLDSVAMAQRHAISQLAEIAGKKFHTIHLVGDFAGDREFCQATADASGMAVKAGPTEARALGNVLMQAMALGDIGSLEEAREIVGNSFDIVVYEPRNHAAWTSAYERFLKLL